jgi:aerobic-type carbon monoxide dehydrogenase small subunit (CoxS/CutS family)
VQLQLQNPVRARFSIMKQYKIRSDYPERSDDPLHSVNVTVNGQKITRKVSPRRLLADFLRHELGLTGTHVGCEHGVCGCCTVIIDGSAARSCLTFAVQVDGAEVRTVESLQNEDGTLHPVQEAFKDCHALQCGFCTPGFLMSIVSQLEDSDSELDLSDDGIRIMLSGNLCRCTGYQNIVTAVRQAAERLNRDQ